MTIKSEPTSLQAFSFGGFELRALALDDGNPWFNLNDACAVLMYVKPLLAAKRHVLPEDRRKLPVRTPGGIQAVNFISETGLYDLIMGSRLPAADRFRRWLTREVIPSIQNDGGYIDPNATQKQLEGLGLRVKSLAEAKRLPLEQREQYLESAKHLAGSDTYALVEISVLQDNAKGAEASQKERKAKWGGVIGGKPDRPDDVYFGEKDGVPGQYHHTKAGVPTKLWQPV